MKNILLLAILSILLISCSSSSESVIQKDLKGQLKFTGNVLQCTVTVDDKHTFVIDKEHIVYDITPGMHTIKVYKNNALKVNKSVYIDSGSITEVEIL